MWRQSPPNNRGKIIEIRSVFTQDRICEYSDLKALHIRTEELAQNLAYADILFNNYLTIVRILLA